MEVKIVALPAFVVVGLRITTKPMSPEIPQLWDRFVPRIGEVTGVAESHVSYGLMERFEAEPDRLDYMSGVAVTSAAAIPTGMARWDVPAQTYAHVGATLPTLGQAFDLIYNQWLPSSGYRPSGGVFFERYGEDFSPDNPRLGIYVPVVKA